MRNRLIITDDNFVFIDVRPMAQELYKCVDLYRLRRETRHNNRYGGWTST